MGVEGRLEALVLSRVRGVGERLFKNLVSALGSAPAVLQASPRRLAEIEGVGPALLAALRAGLDWDWARRELERAERLGCWLVPYGDPEYPKFLAEIPDPPPVLYGSGALTRGDLRAVAIVGSRRASTVGLRFARHLGRALALRGVTVVSGMAHGIDSAAHEGALEARGRTLAVFGSGLDVVHPRSSSRLAAAIRESGACLSEFALGSEPFPHHFPQRNRIISGLSLGVVVVEAAEKSGSLITARAALEQGREVFAVPGLPGAFTSRGAHTLLRSGAKLVERVEDVLEELPPVPLPCERKAPAALPDALGRLCAALEDAPLHIDEVALRAGLGASETGSGLMELELRGLAEGWPGKRYSRVRTDGGG